MQVVKVKQIPWSGGEIDGYVVVTNGPLNNDSIVLAPSLFLLSLAKARQSPKSIKASGHDLKSYFEALEASKLDWRDITDNQMSGYIETTLHKKMNLSKRSITRHCTTLKGMYTFTTNYGLSEKCFDYTFTYSSRSGVTHQGQSKKKVFFDLHNKYINEPLFKLILAHIVQPQGFLRDRDEIVLNFGYLVGLRTSEVTNPDNFSVSKIVDLLNIAEARNEFSFTIDIIGKGNKSRRAEIPPLLTAKIKYFLEGSRKEVPGDLLICNIKGNALSESHATRVFSRAKTNSLPKLLLKAQELTKNSSAPYTISTRAIKNTTFHCLRHSYSTDLVTYCLVNNIDPYALLPDRLGHEDKETTDEYINFEASIYNRDLLRAQLSKGQNDE